jgi:hypothetical protein
VRSAFQSENAPEPAGYEAGTRGVLKGGEVLRGGSSAFCFQKSKINCPWDS